MLKNIRRIVSVVLFVTLVLAGMTAVESVLNEHEISGVQISLNLPRNSVDVAFVGSSKVQSDIVPQYLMDNYGIVSSNFASPSEMFDRSLLHMRTLLQTQKPRVIVCELMGATIPYGHYEVLNAFADPTIEFDPIYFLNATRVTRALSWFNPEKYRSIFQTWQEKPVGIQYVATLGLQQDQALTLDAMAYAQAAGSYRQGAAFNSIQYTYRRAEGRQARPYSQEELKTVQLHEKNRRVLEEMLELSRKHDFELVFLMLPQFWNEAELKVLSQLEELAVAGGAYFIHSDTICEELEIDMVEDLRDMNHLNVEPALRVTEWIGSWLTEHFDLPDRLQDDNPRYDLWKKHPYSYEAQLNATGLSATVGLEEYVDQLSKLDDTYLVVMGTNGHEVLVSDEEYNTMALEQLPLENAPFFADELQSALAIWRGEDILHDEVYEDGYALDLNVEGTSLVISQVPGELPLLNIAINTRPMNLTSYSGLHFVVYDLLDHAVVDEVCFDLRTSNPKAIR